MGFKIFKGKRMKKITSLSLVVVAVLFTACTEETKKAATDTANAATETVKETTANAVDAAKVAAEAAEVAAAAKAEAEKEAAAKEALVAKASEAKATEAAEAIKETTGATTEAISEEVTPENTAGKAAYAKCAGCHGEDGKTKALGKSAEVAGQSVVDLVAALTEYKAGTRNVSGMGMLMKGQVASMSEDDIQAVSEYMSGL